MNVSERNLRQEKLLHIIYTYIILYIYICIYIYIYIILLYIYNIYTRLIFRKRNRYLENPAYKKCSLAQELNENFSKTTANGLVEKRPVLYFERLGLSMSKIGGDKKS